MSDDLAGVKAYNAAVDDADVQYQRRRAQIKDQMIQASRARIAAKKAAYDEWMQWEEDRRQDHD